MLSNSVSSSFSCRFYTIPFLSSSHSKICIDPVLISDSVISHYTCRVDSNGNFLTLLDIIRLPGGDVFTLIISTPHLVCIAPSVLFLTVADFAVLQYCIPRLLNVYLLVQYMCLILGLYDVCT